jgi:uncharacterized protein YbgA (DUF1722 family)/uncharacterized protein YbbK (DUF523 family)
VASKPRIGVSSCLLGTKVRYDGQHKRDAFLADVLSPFVEWVPVCPELELGLGVPREPIRLVGLPSAPRLVAERTGKDHTDPMRVFAEGRVAQLEELDLSGFVLKKASPSCGMERVPVHSLRRGAPRRLGRGAFAAVLMERMPLLPVEEEGRLHDPTLRESFVERIFAYARWKETRSVGASPAQLVRFHAAHELALLAHSPAAYRRLGRLVADVGRRPLRETLDAYGHVFMEALSVPSTRGRHANVLGHMLGQFRGLLDLDDRRELEGVVRDYQRGHVPLVVPLTLFRHHVRRCGVAWLADQVYLAPDPRELMLRNHV